jgi:secondary thiamine-phosphate synthase enzyme
MFMKSYRKELWFNVPGRRAFINTTSQVQECLRESGIQEGLCLVNAQHITASVFINDDAGLWAGCTTARAELASGKPLSWTLGQVADTHLKRHGPPSAAVVVTVTNGRLDFGTWERILCQLDG